MAGRQIQRRILSLIASAQPRISSSKETLLQYLPAANSFFHNDALYNRSFQTVTEANKETVDNCGESQCGNVKPESSSNKAVTSSVNNEVTVKHRETSNLKISARHDLAIIYTCKVCDTRSLKTVSRESYEKGVVLVRCGGCNNQHLIADRLGWFGEPGSIEDFLASQGEEVKKGSADTINLTLEDLAGKKNLKI